MTTPEQHNKYLAIAHLIHGAIYMLTFGVVLVMFGAMFFTTGDSPNVKEPSIGFFMGFLAVLTFLFLLLIIPSFIAGYALLKRKRWAKIAAIIGGVVAAMSFPIGTAVCVYTFWFLFSGPGRLLYDAPAGRSLETSMERERQFLSGSTPPNWR